MTTKPEPKPEKKPLTDSQKLDRLIALAEANGWTIPKEMKD